MQAIKAAFCLTNIEPNIINITRFLSYREESQWIGARIN